MQVCGAREVAHARSHSDRKDHQSVRGRVLAHANCTQFELRRRQRFHYSDQLYTASLRRGGRTGSAVTLFAYILPYN